MNGAAIHVEELYKTYRVPEREAGLRAAARSLIHPTYREVPALRPVSFEIARGEIVGLIGPNGAGKTTTIKLLTGLLHPGGGRAEVIGFIPWQRKPEYLRRISAVLGNKSQLLWDIPALDTLRVLGEIYGIAPAEVRRRVDEFANLLELHDLLTRPVRNLSLGERMKCELAAGLLNRPEVLFLDEPTLGLDVSMQLRLREYIADYNRRSGATVILTSHYMADVTALCPRVILLHDGRLLYDGALDGLARQLSPYKLVRVTLAGGAADATDLPAGVELLEQDDHQWQLRVMRAETPRATAALLNRLAVADLVVEDPPIEAVIDRIYREAGQ